MNKKIGLKIIAGFSAFIFFVIDRYLKHWAVRIFDSGQPFELIGNYFTFHAAKNEFIAFSLPVLAGPILMAVVLAIMLVLIILMIINRNDFWVLVLLFSVLLGAASNFYDRLIYGYVIDYFDLRYFSVFNLADAMIVVGAMLLFLVIQRRGVDKTC